MYDEIFKFDNVPLTETLDIVGYGSTYIIFNLGTIFIFMIMQIILRFIISLMAKRLPKDTRVGKWAKKVHEDFFYAGLVTFFNEIYLCMNFAVLINFNDMKFKDQPTAWERFLLL